MDFKTQQEIATIKRSFVTLVVSYIAAILIIMFAIRIWPITENEAIYVRLHSLWPLNIRYNGELHARGGNPEDWAIFFFGNSVFSVVMAVRFLTTLVHELSKSPQDFDWGMAWPYTMCAIPVLVSLFFGFSERPSLYGLSFYHDQFSNLVKSSLQISAIYFFAGEILSKVLALRSI